MWLDLSGITGKQNVGSSIFTRLSKDNRFVWYPK